MLRPPIFSMILITALAGAYPAAAQLTTGDALLVTPQWLAQHQHDKNIAILQVGPPAGFGVGHVAGSQFIQLRDISTPFTQGTLNLEMPPERELIAAFEKKGISDASKIVVVFDSEWVSPATRVLFTLGYIGLSQNTVLLDGGLAAWKKAGFSTTTDSSTPTLGHITKHATPFLIVDNAYIAAHKSAPRMHIIDARTADFFTHPPSPQNQMSAGHIPGAANVPFTSVFTDDNYLLPRAKLDAIFSAAGVQPGDTVVAYCHVGQQATALLLAARVAGHPVRLYDGSFQDWSMRKLPTEGGPQ